MDHTRNEMKAKIPKDKLNEEKEKIIENPRDAAIVLTLIVDFLKARPKIISKGFFNKIGGKNYINCY